MSAAWMELAAEVTFRRIGCPRPSWSPKFDGTLVGRVSIRHELNGFLANFGRHIGYGVRPAYRRRGYAGAMLRQALVVAHSAGVDRALLRCDDGNEASASIIERAGGVLEDIPRGAGRDRQTAVLDRMRMVTPLDGGATARAR